MAPRQARHLGDWAERVKALRERYGLYQRELAEALGIKRMTVVYWEGRQRVPSKPSQMLIEMLENNPILAGQMFFKVRGARVGNSQKLGRLNTLTEEKKQ